MISEHPESNQGMAFAPVHRRGRLPPGFDVDALRRALSPQEVTRALKALGVRDPVLVGDRAAGLRQRLDRYELRATALAKGSKGPDYLYTFVYRAASRAPGGKPTYKRLIQPAEHKRSGKWYLNATTFEALVARNAKLIHADLPIAPDSAAEYLAWFVLAYGLLQPNDGPQLVRSLAARWSEYADYFGWSDPDEGTTLVDMVSPPPPSVAPEVAERVSIVAVSGASPATTPQPSRETSDDGSPGALLDQIRDTLMRTCEMNESVRDTLSNGEVPSPESLASLASARDSVKALVGEFGASVELTADVPLPPRKAFADRQEATNYVSVLRGLDGEITARRLERVQKVIASLEAECRALGITRPPDLLASRDFAELEAIRERLRPELAARRAYLAALEDPRRETLARVTDPADRLRLYADLERRPSEQRQSLLSLVTADREACQTGPAEGARLVSVALVATVEANGVVAPGTWRFLADFHPGGVAAWLHANRDAATLLASSFENVHVEELTETLSDDGEGVPAEFWLRLRLFVLHRQPSVARVEPLLELARRNPRDRDTFADLCSALSDAGRLGEAVLLASIALRHGVLPEVPLELMTPLLWCLASRAADRRDSDSTLREFLENDALIGDDPEAVVVALYVAHRLDGEREDLLHRHAKTVEQAQRRYPTLVAGWLVPRLRGDPAELPERDHAERWVRARQVLEAWSHAMRKPSCYGAWSSAKEYQLEFRKELERWLEVISNGSPPVPLDAEGIIAAADRRLGTRAEGAARENMTRFLEESHALASDLHEVGLGHQFSVDDLRGDGPRPLRQRLQDEAALVAARAPQLGVIYASALGELS